MGYVPCWGEQSVLGGKLLVPERWVDCWVSERKQSSGLVFNNGTIPHC